MCEGHNLADRRHSKGRPGVGKALGAAGASWGLCSGAQEEVKWGEQIGFAGPCKGF